MKKIIILVLTSVLLVGAETEAQAQSATSVASNAMAKRDQAEQHLREGKLLMGQKKFEEAARAFASAYEEQPAYDIAMALGEVEKRLGRYAKAATHLSYALKHLPLSASVKERDGLRKQMDEVRSQVGALVLEVSPSGAEVMLNGELLGAAPIADEVFVMPGEAKIEARMAGFEPQATKVVASAGGTEKVGMELAALKPEKPKEEPAAVPKRSLVPAYALGAGAALSFGLAIGFEVASDKKADITTELVRTMTAQGGQCVQASSRHPSCTDYESARSSGIAYGRTSIVLTVVGGLLAGGAVAYWLWPENTASASAKGYVTVWPLVSSAVLGTAIEGAF